MSLSIGAYLDEKGLQLVKAALVLHDEDWTWVDDVAAADVWLSDIDNAVEPDKALKIEAPCSILIAKAASTISNLADHQFVLPAPLRSGRLLRLLDSALEGMESRKLSKAEAQAAQKAAEEAAMKAAAAERLEAERQAAREAAEVAEREAKAQAEAAAAERMAELQRAAEQGDEQAAALVANGGHPWVGRNIMFAGKPDFSRYPITAEVVVWLQAMAKGPVSYDAMVENLPMDQELLETALNAAARHGELVDEFGTPLEPTVHEEKSGGSLLGRFLKKGK